MVLAILGHAGVTLRLDKGSFFDSSINYLGHFIRPEKLEVASRTVDAVRDFQPSTDQSELQSFLGMCNVYRRFASNFAQIAALLTKKLKKGEPFRFDELEDNEREAFNALNSRLITPPILVLPRYELKYVLDTDACYHQVGCALLQ